ANRQARKRLVGCAAGDAFEILPEFFFAVSAGNIIRRASMHVAKVARMAAVAAAKIPGRAFEQEHPRPGAPRRDRRAQRRIAAARHKDVTLKCRCRHRKYFSPRRSRRMRTTVFSLRALRELL